MNPLEGLTLSHVALVEAVKESPEIGEERLIDCAVGVAPPEAAVNVTFVGEAARAAGATTTSRIREVSKNPPSVINRSPDASTARPRGLMNPAFFGGPPSPDDWRLPFPATVSIFPSGVTTRMRVSSAMKRSEEHTSELQS